MRTKALILSAAVAVAGMVSSLAQVYSINVVGYVNLELPQGFSLIANQLDNGNGNKVVDLFAGVPDGAIIYKWTDTGYVLNTLDFGAWTTPDMTLNPGEGAFILLPSAHTITLVGEVPEGTLTVDFPAGFWIASSHVPQVMDMSNAAFSFPAADGDIVYTWDRGTQGYSLSTYDFGAWDPAAPVVQVGEAFFLLTSTGKTWTRTFEVQ